MKSAQTLGYLSPVFLRLTAWTAKAQPQDSWSVLETESVEYGWFLDNISTLGTPFWTDLCR
jgi:hypothetical protein